MKSYLSDFHSSVAETSSGSMNPHSEQSISPPTMADYVPVVDVSILASVNDRHRIKKEGVKFN